MDLTPGTPRGEGQLYWYWVGGRSYDPALARYLQPDPAAADGARDYTYAHDDPLDYCQGGTCGGPRWAVIPGVPYNPDQLRLSPSYLTLFLDAVQSAAGAFLLMDAGEGGAGLSDEAPIGGERTPLNDRQAGGCSCFPAATGVDTPHGQRAIATLHVGDMVLAEDPRTGTVTSEPVTAVIDDGIKPLLAVALSDGEAITVTANHPFWVDAGDQLTSPGWLRADALRAGDRLRTADGHAVTVTGLRLGVGHAEVYSLTVARDHTYFVGSLPVLVHNCDRYGDIPAEHHWRYDRYLNDGTVQKHLGPDKWWAKAQTVWANNPEGNGFEQAVRTRLDAPLGRGSKPLSIEGFIPDLPVGDTYGVTDVKNWIDLANSDQLRAFHQYAIDNGLPFNLVIGPRTETISEPLLDNVRQTGGRVTLFL